MSHGESRGAERRALRYKSRVRDGNGCLALRGVPCLSRLKVGVVVIKDPENFAEKRDVLLSRFHGLVLELSEEFHPISYDLHHQQLATWRDGLEQSCPKARLLDGRNVGSSLRNVAYQGEGTDQLLD